MGNAGVDRDVAHYGETVVVTKENELADCEWDAEAYQRAGIFTKNRLSSNYTPNDFSSLVPTKFLLSASLDKEFWLREMDHSSEEVAD